MHLSSSGNIAIVGSFLLFQSLLSDYFGKKKVSSSTTCPATRLPKMDNNHRSNNYFFNDLWCQRKKDKEVKKSFVLACIALFQYNLVPLFLKVPDQIDHSSTTPQEVKYSARSRNHLITAHWVLITFMRPFQIAVVRVLLGINNRQRCLPLSLPIKNGTRLDKGFSHASNLCLGTIFITKLSFALRVLAFFNGTVFYQVQFLSAYDFM